MPPNDRRDAAPMTTLLHLRSHRLVASLLAALAIVATWHFAGAQEAVKNLVIHDEPKALGAISFQDDHGRARSLADFKGKVVLLNLWATWCVSCRKEMPALDRLQGALGGREFEVIPLSIDRGGVDAVKKFYAETGVHEVGVFIDPSGQAVRALGAVGLPTTMLIDRAGRELGRMAGPAEWDSPEIVEFLKTVISKASETAGVAARNGQAQSAQRDRDASGLLSRGFRWVRSLFDK